MGRGGRSSGQTPREQRQSGDGPKMDDSTIDGAIASGNGEYENMRGDDAIRQMASKYGDIGFSSTGFNTYTMAEIVGATDAMLEDFPVMRFHGLVSAGPPPDSDYNDDTAWAHVADVMHGGLFRVEFNNTWSSSLDPYMMRETMSTARGGFHYPNNTAGSVHTHELTHILDARLTYLSAGGGWEAHDSYNRGEVAGTIIGNAARSIGLAGNSASTSELVSLAGKHISGYAGTNIHEALSEAIGDCYANGNNASALSKAVYREAKKYARRFA